MSAALQLVHHHGLGRDDAGHRFLLLDPGVQLIGQLAYFRIEFRDLGVDFLHVAGDIDPRFGVFAPGNAVCLYPLFVGFVKLAHLQRLFGIGQPRLLLENLKRFEYLGGRFFQHTLFSLHSL